MFNTSEKRRENEGAAREKREAKTFSMPVFILIQVQTLPTSPPCFKADCFN